MSRRRQIGARRIALGMTAAAVLAGCGSTANIPASRTDGLGGPEQVISDSGEPGTTVGGGTGPAGGPGTTSADGGSSSSTGGGAAGVAGSGGVGGGQVPTTSLVHGPGVTAKTITIGLSRASGQQDYLSMFGVEGQTQTDDVRVKNILIDYYNKRGGLAGRKLAPVWYTYDAGTTADPSTVQQAACQHYTQDNKIFAALNSGAGPVWEECLLKAGVVDMYPGYYANDVSYYQRFRNLIMPQAMNYSTLARQYVDAMVEGGLLKKADKIGVIYMEAARWKGPLEKDFIPQLRSHGLTLAERYGVTDSTQSAAKASDAARDLSAAVLRFKTAGITRVLFLEDFGILGAVVFMQNAQQQNYYPTYGLTTLHAPSVLAAQSNIRQSLPNSQAIGFQPINDVEYSQVPKNPSEQRCVKILRDGGYAVASDVNGYATSMVICEMFFLLEAGINALGSGALRMDSLIGAIESLGTSYRATMALHNRFNRQHHDGVNAWRRSAYVPSCTCYRYAGPERRFA